MIEVTVTLTVGFAYEDDEEVPISRAKEEFLDWLGTVSDEWILEGTDIKIERSNEQ